MRRTGLSSRRTDSDMTQGVIWRHMLEFSLPMALVIEGNGQKDLFQGTSLDKVNEWEMEENRMIKGCFYLRLRKRGERT